MLATPRAERLLPTGTIRSCSPTSRAALRLWERHHAAIQQALAHHDAILRDAIGPRGSGYPGQDLGDELRMLHCESPRMRSPRLSPRSARWILFSLATGELVRVHLPASIALRGIGRAAIERQVRQERVFQVIALPISRADFFPLKTLAARPNNLPAQTTRHSSVAREEIRAIEGTIVQRQRAPAVAFWRRWCQEERRLCKPPRISWTTLSTTFSSYRFARPAIGRWCCKPIAPGLRRTRSRGRDSSKAAQGPLAQSADAPRAG